MLDQQVKRMLADPRSHELVSNFAGQWLQLRNLPAASPVAQVYPDFDDNLRQSFRTETEMFFESIMREDRSVVDLLNADYTFVNERLAQALRHPRNVYGAQFRRIHLGTEFDVRRGLCWGREASSPLTSVRRPDLPGVARQVGVDEYSRRGSSGSAAERSAAQAERRES